MTPTTLHDARTAYLVATSRRMWRMAAVTTGVFIVTIPLSVWMWRKAPVWAAKEVAKRGDRAAAALAAVEAARRSA